MEKAELGRVGIFQDASKLITLALSEADWATADKLALAEMLEQWLPKVVAPWSKDEKKKLKLNALRVQTQ